MAYGSDIYRDLERKVRDARRHVDTLRSGLGSATHTIQSLENERLAVFSSMAALHMQEVEKGVPGALSEVHQRAQTAIRRREEDVKRLHSVAAAAEREVSAADVLVGEKTAALSEIEARLDAAHQNVAEALSAEPEWQRLKAATADLIPKARTAQEKAKAAEVERIKKEAPYLEDPMFRYLWERGYGTDRYQAGNLTRRLDGWVASLCNYRVASENFKLLRELEEFLEKHTREMEVAAESAAQALGKYESTWVASSEIPSIEAELEKAEGQLDEARDKLRRANQEFSAHQKALNDYADGEDHGTRSALMDMTKMLEETDWRSLEALVARTPNQDDDALLVELRQNEQALREAKAKRRTLSEQVQEADKEASRLSKLESEFTSRNYHRRNSRFDRGFDLDAFLAGYIVGDFDFRDLDSHQRTVSSSSSYGGSGSSGGGFGSGDSFGSSSSSWSGSFSSGGSFGGDSGGFSSGGDF